MSVSVNTNDKIPEYYTKDAKEINLFDDLFPKRFNNNIRATDMLLPLEVWSAIRKNIRGLYGQFRVKYTEMFGFSIITEELAITLADYLKDKKVLEVGSGNGFLAAVLKELGVKNLTAIDKGDYNWSHFWAKYWLHPTYTRVVTEDDVKKHDVIVWAWPDYDDNQLVTILKWMRSDQKLILLSEGKNGCCADEAFFQYLDMHFDEMTQQSTFDRVDRKFIKDINKYYTHFTGLADNISVHVKV